MVLAIKALAHGRKIDKKNKYHEAKNRAKWKGEGVLEFRYTVGTLTGKRIEKTGKRDVEIDQMPPKNLLNPGKEDREKGEISSHMKSKKEESIKVDDLLEGLVEFLKAVENPTVGVSIESIKKKVEVPKRRYKQFRPKHKWSRPIHPRKVRGEEELVLEVKEEHMPLVDLFDFKDYILATIDLRSIKEEGLSFKLLNNVLHLYLKTLEGEIEKQVKIPKNSIIDKIGSASFNNKILEIKLNKRKKM